MELILILLKDIPFNYSLVNFLLKSNKEVRMNKGVFVNVIVSKVGKDKDVLLDLVDVEFSHFKLQELLHDPSSSILRSMGFRKCKELGIRYRRYVLQKIQGSSPLTLILIWNLVPNSIVMIVLVCVFLLYQRRPLWNCGPKN